MSRLNELVRNQDDVVREGQRLPHQTKATGVSFKSIKTNVVQAVVEQGAQRVCDADHWYAQAGRELSPVLEAVRQAQPFSLDGVTGVVQGLIESLTSSDRLIVKAISMERDGLVLSNMVNTAILSLTIGRGLKYTPDDLLRLGLAAILHDVGMVLIPADILSKQGPLSLDERDLIKRHPEQSAQAIRQSGADAAWIADIVAQEHERWGGQGYPRGLTGAEIHECAQIIGLADTFEALLHTRPHRKRFLPHEAVRELVVKDKALFSTRMFKCLIQKFSVFPLGTMVQLNTGEIGEVMQLNPQYPLRPIVKVVMDRGRVLLPEPRVENLSVTSLMHIMAVVQDESCV